jgi:flagellar motility protein MotE (MotC chaperone)
MPIEAPVEFLTGLNSDDAAFFLAALNPEDAAPILAAKAPDIAANILSAMDAVAADQIRRYNELDARGDQLDELNTNVDTVIADMTSGGFQAS